MILPGSYIFSVLLLIFSMICWGSWANAFKAAGKWRFELFYFDFAAGALLVATICAFTLGTLGWDGFSFIDDINLAGKKQDLFAFLAGAIFNLGNMLLLAAVSIAGLAIGFPVTVGIALVTVAVWGFASHRGGSPTLLAFGIVFLLGAIVVSALADKARSMKALMQQIRKGKTRSTKMQTSSKGLVLALVGGVLMGSFDPLLILAKEPDVGLGPYTLGFFFAAGVFFSTFVYNLFFMNLPVQGEPLEIVEYFKGRASQHLPGLFGGGLLMAGIIAGFVTDRVTGPAQPGPALAYALPNSGVLLSALWGLFYWKEFAGAEPRVRTLLAVLLVLFGAGLAVMSLGQGFSLQQT